jgi:hypothetical protein
MVSTAGPAGATGATGPTGATGVSVTGATGPAGAYSGMVLHTDTITSNTTISSGNNAISVGPITQANNITITLASGQRWIVI